MTVPRIIGRFEGLRDGAAIGWASDLADPARDVVVELLCDGHAVAVDRTSVFRADLAERFPNDPEAATCGFAIPVPAVLGRQPGVFTVRVANCATVLEGRAEITDAPVSADLSHAAGEVFATGGLRLTGWVSTRRGMGTAPPRVSALEDGRVIAEAAAAAPLSAEWSRRRFTIRLPATLADGMPHDIELRDETGAALRGSPVRVIAWPRGVADALAAALPEAPPALLDLVEHAAPAGSIPFAEVLAWEAAFPVPERADAPATPAVLLLHGEGDAAASRAALGDLPSGWRLLHRPTARIDPACVGSDEAVVLLRAGDTSDRGAVRRLLTALDGAKVAYADTVQEVDGTLHPWCRPAWDPDLFLGTGYAFGLLAFRAADPPAREAEGDVDALAWAARRLADAGPGEVRHLPQLLCCERGVPQPGAPAIDDETLAAALAEWPEIAAGRVRRDPIGPSAPWAYRLSRALPDTAPRVSVLIPTRDRADLLERAVTTLLGGTAYPAFDITVLDNGSERAETRALFRDLEAKRVRILPAPGAFNFASICNLGVANATAPLVCLLNNDVEIVEPGWLEAMVGELMRPGVGAVGAKLLWPGGMVQHGGIVLGPGEDASHLGVGLADRDPGYCGLNLVARRVSAVTAACMLVRRSDWEALGGMDEDAFAVNYNDVDLCLRLRERGLATVWTPEARLIHHESATRGREQAPWQQARARRERAILRARWGHVLLDDPFYNPNLNRDGEAYEGLAIPPGPRGPR